MYLRTEVRFYNEFVPELDRRGFRGGGGGTPRIFYAGYDLEGLIGEDENSTDQTVPEPQEWSALGKGGSILMEYIGNPYFQESPITMDQAHETLSAVASLHAAAWEDVELLQKADRRLSRGSYHLKTRNVKELAGMEHAWEHFSSHFQHLDPELFQRTHDMGRRIHDIAEYISKEVSPSPTSSYATLSHGDFKSMNCFLSHDGGGGGGSGNVVLVDFASTGVGLGMSDVAMHIHHAILPEDLANGGEERLLEHYLDALNTQLVGRPSRGFFHYTKDVAMRHYRFAVVDYFRFFLGRFWKSATMESFATKKNSKNTALINRNLASALAFLDRADRYLRVIEAEQRDAAVRPGRTSSR